MKMHMQTLPRNVKDNVRSCPTATFGISGMVIVISELTLVLEEKLHTLGIRTGQNIVVSVRQNIYNRRIDYEFWILAMRYDFFQHDIHF